MVNIQEDIPSPGAIAEVSLTIILSKYIQVEDGG